MRSIKKTFLLMAVMLLTAAGLGAQKNGAPLTDQDVISMVKNLLPESVILSAIKTNDTDFDVSANGLIALKKAGVTPKIMEAMLEAANGKKAAPVPAVAPAAANALVAQPASAVAAAPGAPPAWQPTVIALAGNSRVELTAEATQIVHTKAKAASLSALATDQAMKEALNLGSQALQQAALKSNSAVGGTAMTSGVKVLTGFFGNKSKQARITYVWALAGGNAPYVAGGSGQVFEVNYAGIPGVNPDQFEPVLVKLALTPQSNYRLVGATEATSGAEQSSQQDWPIYSSFIEDRLAATVQKLAPGRARLSPAAALPAGEYAVALRPVDKTHKFSGEEVGKNLGEGLVFNYAWPVSVR